MLKGLIGGVVAIILTLSAPRSASLKLSGIFLGVCALTLGLAFPFSHNFGISYTDFILMKHSNLLLKIDLLVSVLFLVAGLLHLALATVFNAARSQR